VILLIGDVLPNKMRALSDQGSREPWQEAFLLVTRLSLPDICYHTGKFSTPVPAVAITSLP